MTSRQLHLVKAMHCVTGRITVFLKSGSVLKGLRFDGNIDGLISFIDYRDNTTTLDIGSIAGFKEEQ